MMMRKKYLLLLMAAILLFPSFLVNAENGNGKVISKDEVVYATLSATGNLKEIYVVNTLDISKAGEILDYGEFSSLKNLTDLSVLNQDEDSVRIDAPEGKFYYQGNMKDDTKLPWDINVTYLLDGQKVDPKGLAGKTGHVEINIETAANSDADKVFFENYLLQISLQLSNKYENIEASDGMMANAGKNKQITFSVMPGNEEAFQLEADVEDFEFQGIEIAAVPSSLPIDTSDIGKMTDDMATLSDAIGDLNEGVAELKDGVSELNKGAKSLRDGSAQYNNGINQVAGGSSELVKGSSSIQEALITINSSLSGNSESSDLSSLSELPTGLSALANGLTETANGLSTLQESYSQAFGALDSAINGIPVGQLTDAQIAELRKNNANSPALEQLLASYSAAQKVKVTYSSVKQAFDAVAPALNEASGAIKNMSAQLQTIANELTASLQESDMGGLAELQKGLSELSANYGAFHSGLVSYTSGVGQLSSSYNELHSGIVQLSGGTNDLASGVNELHNGTNELHEETKDLPEKMEDEINETLQEYDKSDFEPVSFVSPKNENVYSVQFVIKTESIQKEEEETKKVKEKPKKGFWDLLMDLFR